MVGIWFAVLVAAFIAAGVLAQLGWEPGPMPGVKRVLRRKRREETSDDETVAAAQSSAQSYLVDGLRPPLEPGARRFPA